MTNERAIEILEDLSAWLSNAQPLPWSAAEISSSLNLAIKLINNRPKSYYNHELIKLLNGYRNWLEFGQPFYHSLQQLKDCLSIAIETLK